MPASSRWDCIVIGGGPAGLMAAGFAAQAGESVLILEKNRDPGRKLLMTGGSRCNMCNAEPDVHRLVAKYGGKAKALISPFSKFPPDRVVAFFRDLGCPSHVENDQRVFPDSNSAQSVLSALIKHCARATMKTLCASGGFSVDRAGVEVRTNHGDFHASRIILAAGGSSYPKTGSTGDAFSWLDQLGLRVRIPRPSLVPIVLKDPCLSLQGLSFDNVGIRLEQKQQTVEERRGKVLFTHFGLSGPAILNIATRADELSKHGELVVSIDLFPELDHNALDMKLLELFAQHPRKSLRNAAGMIVPPRLAEFVVTRTDADCEVSAAQVPKTLRKTFVALLKDLRFTFKRLMDEDWAVVTSGGLDPDEVNFTTMQLKQDGRISVVGDVLDFERPTGGFSLQICWSTGFVAGSSGQAR